MVSGGSRIKLAPRRWTLRRPRNYAGRPLTADERRISPDADIYQLIAGVMRVALDDLDAGYGDPHASTNDNYWRAQAYLFFCYGDPTGFQTFFARLGIEAGDRLPAHPLFDDPMEPLRRRDDLARLGLPANLFDGIRSIGK